MIGDSVEGYFWTRLKSYHTLVMLDSQEAMAYKRVTSGTISAWEPLWNHKNLFGITKPKPAFHVSGLFETTTI